MTYEYLDYWNRDAKFRVLNFQTKQFYQQEIILPFFLDTVKAKSVFELGAGSGRITQIIKDELKPLEYVGIDISDHRINELKDKFPNYEFILIDITKFNFTAIFDLCVAVEFFMHIKPEDIESLIQNISAATDNIISLDYYPEIKIPLSEHNFIHEYEELYKKCGYQVKTKRIGDQMIYHASRN